MKFKFENNNVFIYTKKSKNYTNCQYYFKYFMSYSLSYAVNRNVYVVTKNYQ